MRALRGTVCSVLAGPNALYASNALIASNPDLRLTRCGVDGHDVQQACLAATSAYAQV
jgi:hypothetical protein